MARDWRYKGQGKPSEQGLAKLRLPFAITLDADIALVPEQFRKNTLFLRLGTDSTPWTGFFTPYKQAKVALATLYGVWFEIKRREDYFAAVRVARPIFELTFDPLPGLDMDALVASGTPVPHSSRATTPAPEETMEQEPPMTTQVHITDDEPEAPIPPQLASSGTTRAFPRPSQFQGFGGCRRQPPSPDPDDYDTRANYGRDGRSSDNGKLEGIPPKAFNGNRACTHIFLTAFNRFMTLNHDSKIARDPIKKCAYFLSLLEGPDVEGWVETMDEWLQEVIDDPEELPFGLNPWQAMQQKFKHAFVDYAERESRDCPMKPKHETTRVRTADTTNITSKSSTVQVIEESATDKLVKAAKALSLVEREAFIKALMGDDEDKEQDFSDA
ncbi:hypothetical protein F5148DRAFT_1286793 [Russula earlei]|uniref:Uncharacterized protein n=1 Tax=Russula earlei TaxID=71964 RepID=A0ACC0U3Z8_9AGAM|nr:hypothetical protein F5148DRAFT_1286793 [Russula earlei]